jgi:hypothetical protein
MMECHHKLTMRLERGGIKCTVLALLLIHFGESQGVQQYGYSYVRRNGDDGVRLVEGNF